MTDTLPENIIDELVTLVERAGEAIMEIYSTEFSVEFKADDSPLTQADLAAHKILVAGLAELTPHIPVISEEAELPDYDVRRHWAQYWLLDPLDGTKEFVNRNGEFTVNVALIENDQPVMGVVGVPVQNKVYTGDVARSEAYKYSGQGRQAIAGRPFLEENGLTLVASRSHGGERLESYISQLDATIARVSRKPIGSSLKLCILAEGEADFYPRLGPTSEWDIAAAHAVLAAAGGDVWALSGEPLAYNKEATILNPDFLAAADRSYPWRKRLPNVLST